jgi:DNA-binding MarR family transcriptional regulator
MLEDTRIGSMTTHTTTASARLGRSVPPAWVRLLRAHATLTRRMDANLQSAHGLTINDYEVLLALGRAPDGRMRRVDLAGHTLLTQSGITRLLQGLEEGGLVERAACDSDRRVVYAQLTDKGLERLRDAGRTHLDDIRALFGARFSSDELDTLDDLLGRVLDGGGDEVGDCAIDA